MKKPEFSREPADLSESVRIKYDKLVNLCRRDLELVKHGVTIILTCTYRSENAQNKLAGLGLGDRSCPCIHNGSAFDIALLRYGKVVPSEGEFWGLVCVHAANVGLKNGCGGFYE